MKRQLCCALIAMLLVTLFAGTAMAAGKATVTKEGFFVQESLGAFEAHVYAQVTNTGDKPVMFNGGLVELFDPDGNAIESSNLYSCYPSVLEPGESGFLYDRISVAEATEKAYIDDYALTVTGKSAIEKKTVRLACEGLFEHVRESSYWTEDYVTVMIKNETDGILRNITLVYALFDAEDNLIYVDSDTQYRLGLPAGQTVEVRAQVYSWYTEAWEAEGIKPVRVETIAYSEVDI